jgi:hypothetical protein
VACGDDKNFLGAELSDISHLVRLGVDTSSGLAVDDEQAATYLDLPDRAFGLTTTNCRIAAARVYPASLLTS